MDRQSFRLRAAVSEPADFSKARVRALVNELCEISNRDYYRIMSECSNGELVSGTGPVMFTERNTVDALAQLGYELQSLYSEQYQQACVDAKQNHMHKTYKDLLNAISALNTKWEKDAGSNQMVGKLVTTVFDPLNKQIVHQGAFKYFYDTSDSTIKQFNVAPGADQKVHLTTLFENWLSCKADLSLISGAKELLAKEITNVESAFEECEKAVGVATKKLSDPCAIDDSIKQATNQSLGALSEIAMSPKSDSETGNYPSPRSRVTKVFAFVLMPVILPLTSLFSGVSNALQGKELSGFWYTPLRVLNNLGFRQSAAAAFDQAISRLRHAQAELDTDLISLLETRFEELCEDLCLRENTERASLRKNLASYRDAARRYMGAVNENKSRGDFRAAAKARRAFVKQLGDGRLDGALPKNITLEKQKGSEVVRAIAAKMYADRGHNPKGSYKIDFYKDGGDKRLKRTRLDASTETGVATHKEERGAIKTALQFLHQQDLWSLDQKNGNTDKHRAAILLQGGTKLIGKSKSQTSTQKVLKWASKGLALSYALGCGFGIAAGLMGLPVFAQMAGGAILAVGLGIMFTAMYNWWLAKYCLPNIVLGMFPKKIESIEAISNASLLWKPVLIGLYTLKAVAWVVQRLIGVALLPLLTVVSGLMVLFSGQSSSLRDSWRLYQIQNTDRQQQQFYKSVSNESLNGPQPGTSRVARVRAAVGYAGWRLYTVVLTTLGILSSTVPEERFASEDHFDYRGDQVAWFMLLVSGSGVALLFLTPLPVIVPTLIIIAGVGALFYKVSRQFASFTNERNEKKVLSSGRRALLSATVSLVAMMAVATAALAIPGLEIIQGVAIEAGAALAYTIFAAFVIVGTIAAMFAIGLVGFVEMFQVPSLSVAIGKFYDQSIAGQDKSNDATAKAENHQGAGTYFRAGTYASFIFMGACATGALCMTMADSIARSLPMFAAAKELMALSMFASMVGLMVQVWTALWKAVVWTVSNPRRSASLMKSSVSSVIDWAWNWGQDRLNENWHEGSSGLTKLLSGLVGLLVLAPVKLVTVILLTHLKAVLVDFPKFCVKELAGLFPSVRLLFAPTSLTEKKPDLNGGQLVRVESSRNTVSTWYVNFTRIGNATGNALLNYDTVMHKSGGSQPVTIFVLIVGFLQSFAALYLTLANKPDEETLQSNAIDHLIRGDVSPVDASRAGTNDDSSTMVNSETPDCQSSLSQA